ncbi:MAG: DNA polymerase III subunit gamma/tau [Lachnospiraceae bacterium]|nr:DNA polymerase III subunit gamma/tau [Lachnospiraceae bacterium]
MSYQALYRKFRPSEFDQVKGQEAIVTTLRNQLRTARVGHAYLFCGTRGTGKTTIAKIMAKAVNCENPQDGNPCGECRMCKAIASGASMNVIEMDAASNNGVDDIRQIVEEVSYSPAEGKYRVYIIDEVHMLSTGAFNALLKTLEEPPSYVIFILATTEANKIPITILSRCQRYDFKRIDIDTIAARLGELMEQEGVQVEEKALRYIARKADGSMRDGLSLLDQCIAFHFGEVLTYDVVLDVLGVVDSEIFGRLFSACVKEDVATALLTLHEVVMQGRDLQQFISDFIWYLRSLLLLKVSDGIEDVVEASSERLAVMKKEAEQVSDEALMRYIRIVSELQGRLRYETSKRVMIEIALIKICRPQTETKNDALVARIRDLEYKLESGQYQVSAPAGAGTPTAPSSQDADLQEKKTKALVKAIPEDIRLVVQRWEEIKVRAQAPMKIYLQSVRLSAEDDKLIVVVPDGGAKDYFMDEDHPEERQARCEELKHMIESLIHKDVEITFRALQKDQPFERSVYPDVEKIIRMEIEQGPDEDGDDPLD